MFVLGEDSVGGKKCLPLMYDKCLAIYILDNPEVYTCIGLELYTFAVEYERGNRFNPNSSCLNSPFHTSPFTEGNPRR